MTAKPIALVIGDVMLDRQSEGEMLAISPEAPVPVIRQTSLTESLGGAGNVARNILALGHEVLLMGATGADAAGKRVAELAHTGGIPACLATWVKPTIVKHRVTCGGQMIARFDVEECSPDATVTSVLSAGIFALPPAQMANIKVIVIADYGKGTMTAGVVDTLRQFAAAYRIPIFVDAKPQTMALYHDVTLLKPNMREALTMLADVVHPALGPDYGAATQCEAACSELRRKYRAQIVVVTNGRYGCCYTDPVDSFRTHGYDAVGAAGPAIVKDICGAGDTTMAALAVGLIEGRLLSASVSFAMAAAGYVVQFYGIKAAARDEVDQFIYERHGWAQKLMTLDGVLAFIARQRRMHPDAQIVLTNGCFDGFHAGHLETLRFGARQGTVLIVAYNDDHSLMALKGPGRPHVPDSFRAAHLAMQECVAAVVRFDGDAAKLVRQLKPDVLVKGADTTVSLIPGADFMAHHGGRIELCPLDNFTITIDRGNRNKQSEGSVVN